MQEEKGDIPTWSPKDLLPYVTVPAPNERTTRARKIVRLHARRRQQRCHLLTACSVQVYIALRCLCNRICNHPHACPYATPPPLPYLPTTPKSSPMPAYSLSHPQSPPITPSTQSQNCTFQSQPPPSSNPAARMSQQDGPAELRISCIANLLQGRTSQTPALALEPCRCDQKAVGYPWEGGVEAR